MEESESRRIIESVGECGRYQIGLLAIVGFLATMTSTTIFSTIFVVAEPELVCSPWPDNKQTKLCDLWAEFKAQNGTSNVSCSFDTTYYTHTIVSEWELVCDRKYLADMTQTVHMLGSIFGFFGGVFGDTFGRRSSSLFFLLCLTISLLVPQLLVLPQFPFSFTFKYISYSVGQFLIGFSVNCYFTSTYILLVESTTERYRTKFANIVSYMYVLGQLFCLIVYYLTQSWHILNWSMAVFSLVMLVVAFFFLPESPLWLLSVGEVDRAVEILKKIATINKRTAEFEVLLDEMQVLKDNVEKQKPKFSIRNIIGDLEITQLFVPTRNLIKLVAVLYIWLSLILLYYGISFNVLNESSLLSLSPYIMFLMSALAEIIGYICCYANDWIGRSRTIAIFFSSITIFYLLMAIFAVLDQSNPHWAYKIVLIALALVGKCSVAGAYNILYIYTNELYPAQIRNTALLFFTCFGGTSSLLAPYVDFLGRELTIWSPHVVYSLFSFIAALILIFILPRFK